MKKCLTWILAISMVMAMLAGCSGSSSSSGDTAGSSGGSPDEKQVTMDMLWWTDGNETQVMQDLIDEYEELHPNITINLQEIAFDDLTTKLQMAIAGGEAPALSRGTESTVSRLGDAMVDFSEYVDTDALQEE